MIQGQKVIAFTPCGRKRYMDLLAAHVAHQHDLGNIDEWILFNNAYSIEDSTYAAQLAAAFPWITVFNQAKPGIPEHIADFYKFMTQAEDVIYFRLDDDVIYIDDSAVPRLVDYRLKNPVPFLVFPTIINNVRTSYHLQQAGVVPMEWGVIKNEMCDLIAWKSPHYVWNLHQKALAALERGSLAEFTLPSETFTDWEAGHISINSFVIFGKDMLECTVHRDEEGYLSLWRPKVLNRQNARAGDAFVIHFAYHTQTEFMDKSGMLGDYTKFSPGLPFRTIRLAPPLVAAAPDPPSPPPPNPNLSLVSRVLQRQMRERELQLRGLKA